MFEALGLQWPVDLYHPDSVVDHGGLFKREIELAHFVNEVFLPATSAANYEDEKWLVCDAEGRLLEFFNVTPTIIR